MRRAVPFSVLLAVGCAPKADTAVTDATHAASLKVLVTGFNDWKDLGDPPNLWRCRDNPSCRLLVGDPLRQAPSAFEGPLVDVLTRDAPGIAWSFATLPVTWGATTEHTLYADYDVVVHLGLGVYDRDDEVYVEAGGYNLRRGTDAAGRAVEEAILSSEGTVLDAPATVAGTVAAVDGRVFGPITARVMPARVENTYLCNETHTLALEAVRRSAAEGGRLREAYFVHIPAPAADDWGALAQGVAGVTLALLRAP